MFNFLVRFAAKEEFYEDMDKLNNSILFSDPDCRSAFEAVLEYFMHGGQVQRDSAPRVRTRFKGISTQPIPEFITDEGADLRQLRSDIARSIGITEITIRNAIEAGQFNQGNGTRLINELERLMLSCTTGRDTATGEIEPAEKLARKYARWYFSVAARFDEDRIKALHKSEVDAARLKDALSLQSEAVSFLNRVVEKIPGAVKVKDTYLPRIQVAIESKNWGEAEELCEEVLKKKFRTSNGEELSYTANMIIRLLKMADTFDKQGKFAQANMIDDLIKFSDLKIEEV